MCFGVDTSRRWLEFIRFSKRPRVSGVFPPHHSACTEAPLTEVGHIWRSPQYQTPYPNPALSPTAPNITLQGLRVEYPASTPSYQSTEPSTHIYITQLVPPPLGDTPVVYYREIILKQACITVPPEHSGSSRSTDWRRDAVTYQTMHRDDDDPTCLTPPHMNCTQ